MCPSSTVLSQLVFSQTACRKVPRILSPLCDEDSGDTVNRAFPVVCYRFTGIGRGSWSLVITGYCNNPLRHHLVAVLKSLFLIRLTKACNWWVCSPESPRDLHRKAVVPSAGALSPCQTMCQRTLSRKRRPGYWSFSVFFRHAASATTTEVVLIARIWSVVLLPAFWRLLVEFHFLISQQASPRSFLISSTPSRRTYDLGFPCVVCLARLHTKRWLRVQGH